MGLLPEAQASMRLAFEEAGITAGQDETPSPILAMLLEVAVIVRDRAAAEVLTHRLAPLAHLSSLFGTSCPARTLAGAAALLGKPDEARDQYRQAMEVSARIRNRPEIALTHLELAELLLDHYPDERAEAREHLDFAVTELRDMKMQPSLERAMGHLAELDARPSKAPAYPGGLTHREVEVLRLIIVGSSNQEIAEALFITTNTVANHVKNILTKTNTANRTEAAAYAVRNGLAAE